jgi:hypothetical protein
VSNRIVYVAGAFGDSERRGREAQEALGDRARRQQQVVAVATRSLHPGMREELAQALTEIRGMSDDEIDHRADRADRQPGRDPRRSLGATR